MATKEERKKVLGIPPDGCMSCGQVHTGRNCGTYESTHPEEEEDPSVQWFTWDVKISVNGTWVADGFDLNTERMNEIMGNVLAWAHAGEYFAEVIKAPDPKRIRKCQGYTDDDET